jgi:hypothetical protein
MVLCSAPKPTRNLIFRPPPTPIAQSLNYALPIILLVRVGSQPRAKIASLVAHIENRHIVKARSDQGTPFATEMRQVASNCVRFPIRAGERKRGDENELEVLSSCFPHLRHCVHSRHHRPISLVRRSVILLQIVHGRRTSLLGAGTAQTRQSQPESKCAKTQSRSRKSTRPPALAENSKPGHSSQNKCVRLCPHAY